MNTPELSWAILVLRLLLLTVYIYLARNVAIRLARRFKRFSLRELLIAMTVAALVMGLMAVLAPKIIC